MTTIRRAAYVASVVTISLYVLSALYFTFFQTLSISPQYRDLRQQPSMPTGRLLNTSAVYDRQAKRMELLKVGCNALGHKPWSAETIKKVYSGGGVTVLVDDRLKCIYCRIAKVASTTWTRVLLVTDGAANTKSPNHVSQGEAYNNVRRGRGLRHISQYTPEQIEYRLKHYFKFMFVRHPLDRLVSAFKDRLKSDHKLPKKIYSRAIKKYRRPNERYKDNGVHFPEFVRYMVDPKTRRAGYNYHWRPQYSVCQPCRIPYDFIGQYETLNDDAAVILQRLSSKAVRRILYPSSDPDNYRHQRNLTSRLRLMYSGISKADINLLQTTVYPNDFQLFGYDLFEK